jgi:preprotein translocase subunit YajC
VTSDQVSSLLLPVLLVAVFWVLVIRPARRRQRELAMAQSAARPGARVMLSSGVYGDVSSADDTDIMLTIAPRVTIKVHRQAIAKIVEPAPGGTTAAGAGDASASQPGASTAAPSAAPAQPVDPTRSTEP